MPNYEKIIENLVTEKVINLMVKLGADRYEERDNYILFPTICHNIDSSEASLKLYYYLDTKLFVCYTNCHNMSIFKFLKTYYETRGIEYNWYSDIYEIVLECSTYSKEQDFNLITDYYGVDKHLLTKRKEKIELNEYNSNVLDVFIKKYPLEWINENISPAAMDKFNILYSISQNKIIIPHYDINGRLIGIRGRALNEEEIELYGKYMPITIEKTIYKHPLSMNLYGLYENKENILRHGICFLVEGEKSVLQAESFPFPNCFLAVCGSNFNKYQLNLLIENVNPKEIVICFDREEKPGEDIYYQKLRNMCRKYKNYCNFSFIYDIRQLTDPKDSPTDKGWEIFKKLFNERVRVK